MADEARASIIRTLETDAELLVVHHLDLLAQIEAQLRAVHHTMRRIERLRTAKFRGGPKLTNGQRQGILLGLSDELAAIDAQLTAEHDCCGSMSETITQMQRLAARLKQVAAQVVLESGGSETPDEGGSLGA